MSSFGYQQLLLFTVVNGHRSLGPDLNKQYRVQSNCRTKHSKTPQNKTYGQVKLVFQAHMALRQF